MNDQLPPSLNRFAAELEQAIRLELAPRRDRRFGRVLRSRPRLLLGTTVGAAGTGAVLALVLSAAGSAPAFAVTRDSNGLVDVTLSDLSDLPALNQELAQDGIPVTAVPLSTSCSATGAIKNPSGEGMPSLSAGHQQTTDVVTIDPSLIPSGDIGVLGASQSASGQIELVFGETTPPAPSCLNSAAFGPQSG